MYLIDKVIKQYYRKISQNFVFNYYDVGSSVPLNKYLLELHEIFKIKLFEPNISEYKKLENLKSKKKNLEVYPYAISDKLIEKLNIYHRPNFSSFYSIDKKYKDFIRGDLRKISRPKVKCVSLKNLLLQKPKKLNKNKKNITNILKIDTQGHNIKSLISAKKKIKEFSVIILENDFFPIYKKQSLYFDSDKYLLQNILFY